MGTYHQKVYKSDFFKLLRLRVDKQVSEVRKKGENNVWNLDLGQKWPVYFLFFKHCVLAPQEVNLFQGTTKRCKEEIYLNKSLEHEKSEELTLEISI